MNPDLDSAAAGPVWFERTLSCADEASAAPPPSGAPIAPRYLVRGELARGGLGRILEAHDEHLDRPVAIKEPLSADNLLRERFLREAAITARLQHPAIVPVYDAGTRNGEPYYVMKLLSGGRTLGEMVAAAPGLEARLRLLPNVIAVADAIAYAHSLGIIHRDLKPSNVLVGAFGETVVIDWGLAKDLSRGPEADDAYAPPYRAGSSEVTAAGSIVGTPKYMAPEQARGEKVDRRADVYALGAVLYYVLSGSPPYQGQSPGEVLAQVEAGAPMPLGRRQRGLPPDLVAVVDKAMARDPAARYATAEELVEDLKRFGAGQLVRAHQYTLRLLLVRWVGRHRVAVAVAAICAALLATLGWTSVRRIQRERAVAVAGRNALILEQARAALDHDPTVALEWLKAYPADGAGLERAQAIAADAYSRGVAWHILPGGPVQSLALSPDARFLFTVGPQQPLRQWDLRTGAQVRAVWLGRDLKEVRVSPDGARVAVADFDGEVLLWTPASGARERVHDYPGNGHDIAFSPDGRLLASTGVDQVFVYDTRRRAERLVEVNHGGATALVFAPDGKTLAIPENDGTVHLWDVARGTMRVLRGHQGAVNYAAFSPDGAWLASTGEDHTVRLWDVAGGRGRVLGRHDGAAWVVRFAPRGHVVASGGWDHRVRLWNLDSGEARVLTGHAAPILDLAFAPDGARLASAGKDGQVRLWDPTSGESQLLLGHGNEVRNLAYSADGRLLVSSGDATTRVWRVGPPAARIVGRHRGPAYHVVPTGDGRVASDGADGVVRLSRVDGGEARDLTGHTREVFGLALSPDGTLLASAGADDTARVWNLATGEARVLAGGQHRVTSVSFSADGAQLATAGSDGTIQLWDPRSGARQGVLTGHRGQVWRAVFSRVGRLLASAGDDGTVRLWDARAQTGRILGRHEGAALAVSFAPDGARVASGGADGTIRLWDVAGGAVRVLRGHQERISQLAFSSDGRALVSTSWDDTVRVWNPRTGASRVLRGPRGHVRALAISPDGRTVAAGSDDHQVHLWDLDRFGYAVLRGAPGMVRGVAWTRDGKTLLSASEDGTIRQWRCDPAGVVPRDPAGFAAWMNASTTAAPAETPRQLDPP